MLPERYLKLSSFFKATGFRLDLTSLRLRIALQKKVYFAQAFGMDLGYDFGWHVFGPYSTELTKDAYGLLGLESRIEPAQNNDMPAQIRQLNKFFGEARALGSGKNESYWLELLSSLHFLNAHAAPHIATKAECIDKIKLMKSGRFSDEDIELAWGLLAKYNLVSG
jgi:uncharacterized protein YwgA